MKKLIFSFIALLVTVSLTTCNLFGPPHKDTQKDPDWGEWPSDLPEEEVRYDENGNPMHKIGVALGGRDGRALDEDVAMACINYFEVVLGVKLTTASPYAGEFYRAAGYYPITNTENPTQPRNLLWMWIPADLSVQIGYNSNSLLCFGGFRRKRNTLPVDEGGEIMDQNKPDGFDNTLLAVGSVTALYYTTGTGITGWVNKDTPIVGGAMVLNNDVWQIRFTMTALEIDGRAASSSTQYPANNSYDYNTFRSAVTTLVNNNLRITQAGIHGAFYIRGPVDANGSWAATNSPGGDLASWRVNYSSVYGGVNSPGNPNGGAPTPTTREPWNYREWPTVGGEKRVPYFELPPNNTQAPLDGDTSIYQNPAAPYHRVIIAHAFVGGFIYERDRYPADSYDDQFLQAMIMNSYIVPIEPQDARYEWVDTIVEDPPDSGTFVPGPPELIEIAAYPMAINQTSGMGFPNILSTNEAIVKGYTPIAQSHFYWGSSIQGCALPIYIHTGNKGWAMISIDIPFKVGNVGDGNNPVGNPNGDIWYLRNGMYLNLPDTGYSQDSLGGGILIRVCSPDDPWESPPPGLIPADLMPTVGWTPSDGPWLYPPFN